MRVGVQLFLASLICLSATTLSCQNSKPDDAPLEIFSTVETASVCQSQRVLKFQTIVLNTGTSEVAIDAKRIYSNHIAYTALIDTEKMEYRQDGMNQAADSFRPTEDFSTILPPGGFYRKEIEVPLDDKFFDRNGYYEIVLSPSVPTKDHGGISSSHSFIFEIHSCGP